MKIKTHYKNRGRKERNCDCMVETWEEKKVEKVKDCDCKKKCPHLR
jgi:hypothetical protein